MSSSSSYPKVFSHVIEICCHLMGPRTVTDSGDSVINLGHMLDLFILFIVVPLVDAQAVDPKTHASVFMFKSEPAQSLIQVGPYRKS
jgi:hypothetical protein